MASVTSFGIHQPTGLGHAISENILPPDPSPDLYSWEIFPDTSQSERDGEDELLVTKTTVLWSRGGIFRKSFNFAAESEPINQALITQFPTPEGDAGTSSPQNGEPTQDKTPALSKALVVFLKTQAHIFFLSGTSHVVHMPFEVECACAAPVGVVIQRKSQADNSSPIALKFPRVPPNSFISPHVSPVSQRSTQLQFSTEGMGKPKTLPLRLSSTLEDLLEPGMHINESQWPRLVCLTDPFSELGLVVTQPDKSIKSYKRRSTPKTPFLDPAEEILHIETVRQPGQSACDGAEDLVLAITVNREASNYTIWRLAYLNPDDILTRRAKPKPSGGRRRSSMQPGLSGATSPVNTNFRESTGAQIPMKKTRRSERVEKSLEQALSMDGDTGGEVTRRQSRRVSSLLARADLSASHERASFANESMITHPGGRRIDSRSSLRGRVSGSYMPLNVSGSYSVKNNGFLEAPTSDILESLRTGGDFDGFQNIGLDDLDLVDGLSKEIHMTKIHSIPMDNNNVRYSLSSRPARSQCKVFVVVGPPFAVDEDNRTYLLIGIQDPVDKRLQLQALHVQTRKKKSRPKSAIKFGAKRAVPPDSDMVITWGPLRRAQSVVDSCKVIDGDQSMILILSEDMAGERELSIQGPWSELTKVILPLLYYDNIHSLEFAGRYDDKKRKGRRSIGAGLTGAQLEAVCHSKAHGMVDIRDKAGAFHRIQIKLEPTVPQARQLLDVCRSILPDSHGERMLAGWWHIMQWMAENHEGQVANVEWSCCVIELFVLFLALDPANVSQDRQGEPRTTRNATAANSSSNWNQMQEFETPRSLVSPAWMQSKGWRWLLEEPQYASLVSQDGSRSSIQGNDFIKQHIELARGFMASATGVQLVGKDGYLPTATGRSLESRRSAAWSIMMGLHLILEEKKLNTLDSESVFPGPADIRVVACQIARWLKWHDFVQLYELGIQTGVDPSRDSDLDLSPPLPKPEKIPSILDWVQEQLGGSSGEPFPTLADVYSTATQSHKDGLDDRRWSNITPRTLMLRNFFRSLASTRSHAETVETLHRCGITGEVLETLPEAIATPLRDAISMCQSHPPQHWPKELLELVNRTDISLILQPDRLFRDTVLCNSNPSHVAQWDLQLICRNLEDFSSQGLEDGEGNERQAVVRALFKDDRRLNEAQNLLSTNKPRVLRFEPNPKWTDAEYLEKQKEVVTTLATGTLAIPAGRGMLYYSLRFPLLTQKFPISGFQLSCNIKPANVSVSVDKSLFTEEKVNWAFFHQGVAAGLAISPQAKGIDTSWILYNKPGNDLNHRHAGFLLALGLNGHLKSVAKWVAFKYLTPKHTMTSIGLLLGLAASYIGTMDSLITRLLSVHVTRMLPPGAAELNLSHLTQTTGIMGIGLLYCNTQHRRMSEVMMSEIQYIDDEDEEDPLRNEGYRLAAGFALGFINLGKGADLKGLHDMRLTEKLLTVASAAKRVEVVNVLDRSAAGAVVALALIFMKTEDPIVARKVDVPDSILQFDYVRPDMLLLRTVAKNLILWSKIEPSIEWVHGNLPAEYRKMHRSWPASTLKSSDLPFFAIMAGLCFSMALRYAGSANERVRDVLIHYLDGFLGVMRQPATTFDAQMARGNARMCVDVLALSCATVMAGTGDLTVLRRLRLLHGRDDAHTTYGSHMAAHLAVGALFLGCGTMTFGTSNLAIAALLVAFYPLFPANVQDNRSHLQAFRHFWVLATEPRCLVVKDMATGQPISVPIMIQLKQKTEPATTTTAFDIKSGAKTKSDQAQSAEVKAQKKGSKQQKSSGPLASTAASDLSMPLTHLLIRRNTPCLLPPLEDIASIRTDAAALGYWDLTIDFTASNPVFQDNSKSGPIPRAPRSNSKGEKDKSSNADMMTAFRANPCLHLRRRPARDSVFGATLQALGRRNDGALGGIDAGSARAGAAGGRQGTSSIRAGKADVDPLEWVFSLPSLRGLTHAERAVVLDRCTVGDEGSSAVDARLVLEEALEAGGRDELLGLRLLFDWAEKRRAAAVRDKAAKTAEVRVTHGKGKGVQISEPVRSINDDALAEPIGDGVAGENGWWMRDSVIEMLKGKAWLASQGRR
ncbi:hypothetical protein MGG_03314 [Pyricularia oryzae 70-15]|uniref:Uncharacterized protein n=1 Tax=Pyricularia oryzae (strain 70-15 / ATCC MYA-4617 / FGSC 8958) TaxID=242507 RepID=G4N983_PYRO7|nr:uncharacterized protein MGG_03314 [Pyricularia oryzae 70-15]EHA50327.1 hypothetical protein MGG_03314 [Pyricularia oryzae 70-15]KAI7926715.1 hypothetical protein M0657_003545 [Pyricularia oryzae]